MFERLERVIKLEVSKTDILRDGELKIELQVSEERSKVVRVIPTPAGEVYKIILVNEFESIDIVCKYIPKLLGLTGSVNAEITLVVLILSSLILVDLHLLQT